MTVGVPRPIGFLPGLAVDDPLAGYWLGQATLRLRREIAWGWHERGGDGTLPKLTDALSVALDLMRWDAERQAFFDTDETAAWLSKLIAEPAPLVPRPIRGSFAWVVAALRLADVDCLALALALGGVADSARGSVVAACQNESGSAAPRLSLLQRLWDAPNEVLPLLDAGHPLRRFGLLAGPAGDWEGTLEVAPGIAQRLLYPAPGGPVPVPSEPIPDDLQHDIDLTVARLKSRDRDRLTILPVSGPAAAPHREVAARIARALGMGLREPRGAETLADLAVTTWLEGTAPLVPFSALSALAAEEWTRIAHLPVVVFAALTEADKTAELPPQFTATRLRLKPLPYAARLEAWRRALPAVWAGDGGRAVLTECARRFRYEKSTIARIGATLAALGHPPTPREILEAARADLDLGDLAEPVYPRFTLEQLMLPKRQAKQVRGLVDASRVLGAVHHDWGTARAWNESGLSVLFSGPPGTGKTMAAEAIAAATDMPIYRIDLSQVVNKYIGETEKNLRRLFDAADAAHVILFFDEADALFGKRTEVKDAHDRYANLEVSYLLERMERFKGMAILASNRKKDLDEAFMRRLRYVVSFPLPGPQERLRIWRAVLPAGADCSGLDLEFLAERIPLSGGHIRSAVFNACLASAAAGDAAKLGMDEVVRAVKDEFDKLGRAVSLDQFGAYADFVRD
jgi:hypothetical protein